MADTSESKSKTAEKTASTPSNVIGGDANRVNADNFDAAKDAFDKNTPEQRYDESVETTEGLGKAGFLTEPGASISESGYPQRA